MAAKRILISGIVQGVGFRPFIYKLAKKYELGGWVKNLGDAGVEIVIEGKGADIKNFIDSIEAESPPNAEVESLSVEDSGGEFKGFKIIKSGGYGSTGVIPADNAICESCLKEIFEQGNRRHHYPFTSCTDCGSRFSTTKKLPYDRQNTSFSRFPMCKKCSHEYDDPADRRFHHQGNVCPECGPRYTSNIKDAADVIIKNGVIAIKGLTGIHIACRTTDDDVLKRLRKGLRRPGQPFAIMAQDIEAVEGFADVSKKEREMLVSPQRPIVILNKSGDYWLSEFIAPGLHNVGVMLPYAGIHHLIFENIDEPLVMTSANFPGEPMFISNKAVENLRDIADIFLLHDLGIQRCDDSIIRFISAPVFLRRSRGFVPKPIDLPFTSEKVVLAAGAELNTTACLIKKDRAYLTQYIGNTSKFKTLGYLKESIGNLLKITDTNYEKVDVVACDLHPNFNTTRLAEEISGKYNTEIVSVQHHYAHLASLLAEYDQKEIICISVDGVGYGTDGKAWGGEILLGDYKGFKRSGHLKQQRMPGGDLTAVYPLRMLAGILYDSCSSEDLYDFLLNFKDKFKHKEKEIEIIVQQLEKNINVAGTTSCGRVLDAISALLGICYERTYEGEPAIKLESKAYYGKPKFEFPIVIKDNILDTTKIIERAAELELKKEKVEDIAASAQSAIAEGLAEIAVRIAKKNNIGIIGLSGGVGYNETIVNVIKKKVEENNLEFLTHSKIPCGDGGISFGQGVVGANS
ncbi:MAG: carbamoyltransferase HypF [Candidatus Altiarchaeales archaeon WOR_SM1_86-2]|nr:MAG: carbamoyltransferase HypF [Candidatus Altiarchaeales archaeon WOR_SM1_86-2]